MPNGTSTAPRPSGVVPQEDNYRILAYGATVPDSWTTIYPRSGQDNSRTKTTITYAIFKSTDATTYTVQIRFLDPSGVAVEGPQAQLAADGEFFIPYKDVVTEMVEPGWSVQIIGSGAGTVNVTYKFNGIEKWLPS